MVHTEHEIISGAAVRLPRPAPAIEVAATRAKGDCHCGFEHEIDRGLCPVGQPEFPRFFSGQLVEPDDLQAIEERVFTHEQLRARHTIGWGIACGFRVAIDGTRVGEGHERELTQLKGSMLRVEAGYGIDRYGRDVYLAENRTVPLAQLFAEYEERLKQAKGDPWCSVPGCEPTPPTRFCIAVRYNECPEKPVPSYAQQCGTPKTVCEYSRIREDVEIRIFGDNEFPQTGAGGDSQAWCGGSHAPESLVQAFMSLLEIPHGDTDVAGAPARAEVTPDMITRMLEGDCSDLLHLARPCELCLDWPWIPLACFVRRGDVVTAPDCRVRRTIYSLQELEAMIVRIFCALVHQQPTRGKPTALQLMLEALS